MEFDIEGLKEIDLSDKNTKSLIEILKDVEIWKLGKDVSKKRKIYVDGKKGKILTYHITDYDEEGKIVASRYFSESELRNINLAAA